MKLPMKDSAKILLLFFLLVLSGCESKIPTGYYEATIIGESCTLMAQIKGGEIGAKWEDYDNSVYIHNLPKELSHKGAKFYFKSYKIVNNPRCVGIYIDPAVSIDIDGISTKKPK